MRIFTVVFLLLFSLVACTRAEKDSTKISISLPNQQKIGTQSACTSCLKFIAINVSGPGIAQTIYAKKEHGDFQEEGTEISDAFIEIEVPVGSQRQFQMIAAYKSSSSDIEIKYGTTTSDLVSGETTIDLPLSSLGTFEGGHIVGRYLTGTNIGPTGLIDIKITPYAGMPKFTLLKSSIINGWFDFFASKNFEMTYAMPSGQEIFSDIRLDDDFLPANLASNQQVARVTRPTSYFRQTSASVWTAETEDSTDIVYGFFFAPGVSDASKNICKASTGGPFTNLAGTGAGTPLLNYDPSGSTGDVNVYGGSSTCGVATQQYESNSIYLDIDQFDGNGNDHAKSIDGVFSYFSNAGQIKKYVLAANTYYFKVLPGVFAVTGGFANSVKLFHTTTSITNTDNLRCTQPILDQYGFTEVALSAAPSFSGTSLSVTTLAAVPSGNLMVCPTLFGVLRGFGGMYMGSPSAPTAVLSISGTPPYNFGTVATGGAASNLFTITNTGSTSATTISEVGLAAPYNFAGGSYPGTGGTCTSTLASGSSCTIAIAFSPSSNGVASDTIDIQYFNSSAVVNATFNVTGTGANPALLSISDPGFDFGSVSVSMTSTHTFTVTNIGGVMATALSDPGSLGAPFNYVGGSFPGAGGTCSAVLASGASCNINVVFSPMTTGVHNDSIDINYNNGVSPQVVNRSVTGTGIP